MSTGGTGQIDDTVIALPGPTGGHLTLLLLEGTYQSNIVQLDSKGISVELRYVGLEGSIASWDPLEWPFEDEMEYDERLDREGSGWQRHRP